MSYKFPRTDEAAVIRETTFWTGQTIGVITAVAVAIMALALVWTTVFRPAQLAAEREQNVQSQQSVDSVRTAVNEFITDYNKQESAIANLKAAGTSDGDQRIVTARAAEKADINSAHDEEQALPGGNFSTLPKDQQAWLTAHPRS